MQRPVEKALWFIESHFGREITLDDVAGACGLSRFQMSRLFSRAVGASVTAYVRGRRLTQAAHALAEGAPDILAVALEAGYGSHEAFSRAFRDQFGLTPAKVRSRGALDGLALVGPLREDPSVAVDLAPPRFETRGRCRSPALDAASLVMTWPAFQRSGRSSSRILAQSPVREAPPPMAWSGAWR
jgi:AraC family transcriptional regulator